MFGVLHTNGNETKFPYALEKITIIDLKEQWVPTKETWLSAVACS